MKAMTPSFFITSVSPSDCPACARLLVEQLNDHGIEASAGRLSEILQKVVADGTGGFLLAARESDRIIGVAYVANLLSIEHGGVVAWLEELYVTPAFRSRGVGAALVNAVIDQARRSQAVAVELEVDAGHNRAESLYRRSGFRPLNRSRWVRELKP
jgi:GNAT superfamily N-acetyltransferase